MDFIKFLYEKFFMRDLLGKIMPGIVVSIALFLVLGLQDSVENILKNDIWCWYYWLPVVALAFFVGLAVQIGGEFFGIVGASPRGDPFFSHIIKCKRFEEIRKANADFRTRQSLITIADNQSKWKEQAKQQRERYVYLKEGSGNLSLALMVLMVLMAKAHLAKLFPEGLKSFDSGLVYTILAVMAFLLLLSHRMHAVRQAEYEVNVLRRLELIKTDAAADEMRSRFGIIGKWLIG